MASVVTTAGGTGQSTKPTGNVQSNAPMVPFIRASQEHRESVFDKSVPLTTADQDQGTFPVPAYGYIRSVLLHVNATGGASTPAVVFAEDGPFNALKNVLLQEPNGTVISQFNSGYDLYLANKYGGYRGYTDPRNTGGFSTSTTVGNFQFAYRVPLELRERDALGSLPNQNAAAPFQIRWTVAASTTIYTTPPGTTLPTVRVRAWLEAWDQPDLTTDGLPNQTMPPAMNTTQFWTPQSYAVVSGLNTIRLTRVGNYIRNLLFIFRSSNLRSTGDTNWPDVVTIFWDTRPLDNVQQLVWRTQMYERYGFGNTGTLGNEVVNGQDNGVYAYDFTHEFDGVAGYENNDLWLPTLGSTRLEIQGNFGAAGTLTVLTNDVAIAGNVFM